MLRLPERPTESFLTLISTAAPVGIFAFYRDAFLSGQTTRGDFNYQHDGLDGYFHLAARRHGPLLVVSFTDVNDQPRSAVEYALHQSQTSELATRAEAGRQRFYDVLMHLPALVAVYEGPELVYTFTNTAYKRYFPAPAQLIGRSLREVLAGCYGPQKLLLLLRCGLRGDGCNGGKKRGKADEAAQKLQEAKPKRIG